MTILAGIKRGINLAGKIDKKYNLNKIFIQKYVPPGYRKTANKLVDIAGMVGGGYGIYNAFIAPDSPGNNAPTIYKKQPETYKPYQTRGGFATRTRSRRPIKQRCYPIRRRTSFSKYY